MTPKIPLPEACSECGRSHLTHCFLHEIIDRRGGHGRRGRLYVNRHTEVCPVCRLTDSKRLNRRGFEIWFRRAVRVFKEEEGLLETETKPSPQRPPRYNREFMEVMRVRMRYARKRRKITQEKLSEALGYSRIAYNFFENATMQWDGDGPRINPRAFSLARASQVLGCSLEWLCGISDDPGWKTPDIDPALGFEEYLRREMEKSGA